MGTACLQKTVLLNSFHFNGERKNRITLFDVFRLNMHITNILNEPNLSSIQQCLRRMSFMIYIIIHNTY